MAINVMSWVWRESAAEGPDLLVLLAIADAAHDSGDNAWPSVKTLAEKARVNERTVQRCVRRLVASGELEVDANGGPKGTNRYRVTMSRPAGSHPVPVTPVPESPRQADGAYGTTGGGDSCVTGGVTPVSPEPSLNHPEPSEKHSSSEAAPRPDVERLCLLLADLIEANGSKRPRINDAWRKACRLLLDRDNRSEQQVENAIRWCQQDEFWRSNVLSMPKLREKYDQLRLAAQRAGPKPKASTTDERVRAGIALTEKFAALEGASR